ncbi:predicted protein [Postia placenta Mad-698-R]|uniref:Uncharacterized protein n=1 Tax=Postia placenta MAD-698-R-SB12 TaxID=670580 RepID=A0A1X6MYM8_9APHY|nr:hypothetical protein POSPLADRAFT_1145129 [Postia placenta MAD-698-R-SB12]EED83419.1 predicted protein [Postia placenta Mad-698-R]OSX61481.1 hypothetical protein POSPLADRAFT_1145129 [Postia placenta MAD-698-R-SB12]
MHRNGTFQFRERLRSRHELQTARAEERIPLNGEYDCFEIRMLHRVEAAGTVALTAKIEPEESGVPCARKWHTSQGSTKTVGSTVVAEEAIPCILGCAMRLSTTLMSEGFLCTQATAMVVGQKRLSKYCYSCTQDHDTTRGGKNNVSIEADGQTSLTISNILRGRRQNGPRDRGRNLEERILATYGGAKRSTSVHKRLAELELEHYRLGAARRPAHSERLDAAHVLLLLLQHRLASPTHAASHRRGSDCRSITAYPPIGTGHSIPSASSLEHILTATSLDKMSIPDSKRSRRISSLGGGNLLPFSEALCYVLQIHSPSTFPCSASNALCAQLLKSYERVSELYANGGKHCVSAPRPVLVRVVSRQMGLLLAAFRC